MLQKQIYKSSPEESQPLGNVLILTDPSAKNISASGPKTLCLKSSPPLAPVMLQEPTFPLDEGFAQGLVFSSRSFFLFFHGKDFIYLLDFIAFKQTTTLIISTSTFWQLINWFYIILEGEVRKLREMLELFIENEAEAQRAGVSYRRSPSQEAAESIALKPRSADTKLCPPLWPQPPPSSPHPALTWDIHPNLNVNMLKFITFPPKPVPPPDMLISTQVISPHQSVTQP